eukprot:COSAG06_NODE_1863_length_8195_cov_190.003088_3_plen_78_part_00
MIAVYVPLYPGVAVVLDHILGDHDSETVARIVPDEMPHRTQTRHTVYVSVCINRHATVTVIVHTLDSTTIRMYPGLV